MERQNDIDRLEDKNEEQFDIRLNQFMMFSSLQKCIWVTLLEFSSNRSSNSSSS